MDIKERVKELKYSTACCICQYYKYDKCENKKSCFWKDLEQALTELEEDKNDLENIKQIFEDYQLDYKLTYMREALLLLKQYQGSYGKSGQKTITDKLKEYEKQKQILEVLKNKKVDIWIVDLSNNVKEYNNSAIYEKLTETEFSLLKEWLK